MRNNKLFQYAPMYRPPAFAGLPKGWILLEVPRGNRANYNRPDLPLSVQYDFGVIGYEQPLSVEDVEKYELTPLGTAVERARQLGRDGWKSTNESHKVNAPALDRNFIPMLSGLQPGESIEVLDAWNRGFHEANINAPFFDAFEVHGCQIVQGSVDVKNCWIDPECPECNLLALALEGNVALEQCDDHEADLFTLYGHIFNRGLQSILDFPTRAAAEAAQARAEALAKTTDGHSLYTLLTDNPRQSLFPDSTEDNSLQPPSREMATT